MKVDTFIVMFSLFMILFAFNIVRKGADTNRGEITVFDYGVRQATLYKRSKYSEALADFMYNRIKTYQELDYWGKQLLLWDMYEYLEKEK